MAVFSIRATGERGGIGYGGAESERCGCCDAKRETGARTIRGLELAKKPERLYTLRQLHKEVFG